MRAANAERARGLVGALGLGLGLVALPGQGGCGPPVACAEDAPATLLEAGGRVSFASFSHTCAVVAGEVQCWGAGGSGQLGDGQMIRRRPLPVRVQGLAGPATALAAGGSHSCAIVGAKVLCWGDNTRGQGGVDRPLFLLTPSVVPSLPGPVTALAAGSEHTCAVSQDGLWCWGRNEVGETGVPPRDRCRGTHVVQPCSTAPARIGGIEGRVTAVSLGARHGCALAEGTVWCWGDGAHGQLGDGARVSRSEPGRVAGLPAQITAVALGREHGCALAEGRVWCWGAASRGQQGADTREGLPLPHPVEIPEAGVRLLAAGGDRTCVAGDRVWCWGDGEIVAAPVDGVTGPVSALALGVDHACAAEAEGRVRCWGDNDYGQLGSGDAPRDHPVPVPVANWDDGRLRDRNADGRLVVVCLGDSNTARGADGPPSWCERLAGMLAGASWEIVNRGLGGATAVPRASLLPAEGPLEYALESDAPDAVILAYGTNDVLAGAEVGEIVSAYQRLARRAQETGAVPFVALTPPLQPASSDANGRVLALNRALRDAFDPTRVIDFHAGFETEQFSDRLHLNEIGQARRARLAAAALEAALGPVDPL